MQKHIISFYRWRAYRKHSKPNLSQRHNQKGRSFSCVISISTLAFMCNYNRSLFISFVLCCSRTIFGVGSNYFQFVCQTKVLRWMASDSIKRENPIPIWLLSQRRRKAFLSPSLYSNQHIHAHTHYSQSKP